MNLRTLGRAAAELGEPLHRVRYAVDTRKIEPAGRVGVYRVFDDAGVEKIRQALAEMKVYRSRDSRQQTKGGE